MRRAFEASTQHLGGVILVNDSAQETEWQELRKEGFCGKIEQSLELLGQMLKSQQTDSQCLQKQQEQVETQLGRNQSAD